MIESLLGLIHLAIAIWAILNIVKSHTSTGKKIIWALIVIIFPLVGLIAWYFLGPKATSLAH